jgi:putative spermidine/putrescine transport system permease protein
MAESRVARTLLGLGAAATLAFIYGPLVVIGLYAFNANVTQGWPIEDFSTKWFRVAWEDEAVRDALWVSVQAALGATALALVLGTLASLAVARYEFFGRETISFVVILPIALPGIITGLALQATFQNVGVSLGLLTIVVGHATFCIVVVYNNAIARLRRTAPNLVEASMDLGADGFQTFRHVLLPNLATALLAGGMLAFALSFDEVIVTTFTAGQQTTLPIWMLGELVRPRQRPVTNVVAVFVIAVTLVPILVAYRVTRGTETVAGGGK